MSVRILYFGLRFSSISIAFSIIAFWLLVISGKDPFLLPLYLDFRIISIGIPMIFCLMLFRDYKNGGSLHYSEGMSLGFPIYTATAMVLFLLIWPIMEWIYPEIFNLHIAEQKAVLLERKQELEEELGTEDFAARLAGFHAIKPLALAIDYFIKTIIIGIFLNVLFALIARKST